MPASLATLLTFAAIGYLFWRDRAAKPDITKALWIPQLWMWILCSRFASEWLNLVGIRAGAVTLEEGSPVDALIYFVLLAAGALVLVRRQVRISQVISNNRLITIFLAYCLLSVLWSDFPFVAFKRWIKVQGHPLMALIIFSEPDPRAALTLLLKRTAYLVVPISILFIKYYPQWGRGFSPWSGAPFNMGITTNKNALGYDCMILGLFFVWRLIETWGWERTREKRKELLLCSLFLGLIFYLFYQAQSSTPLVAFAVGVAVMLGLGLRFVNPQQVGTYFIVGILFFLIAEVGFSISSHLIAALGKNPTLTDRTFVWKDVPGRRSKEII